jgi:hypothetical protein
MSRSFSREELVKAVSFSDTDPDTEREIAEVEHRLKVRFPDTYRTILAIGGEAHMGPIPCPADRDLHFDFLPMKRERFEHVSTRITSAFKRIQQSQADMRAVVPFGAVGNGDMVCFDFRTGAEPTIVLWNHERAYSTPDPIAPVAPTFDAFIEIALKEKQGHPASRGNLGDAP